MTIIFFSLASIVTLYFAFALLAPSFFSKRICAICVAVSLTWAGLLATYLLSWHNNVLFIGILMGGSVVGIMYKMEKYWQKKQLANFWLTRLLIIIFGFLMVYLTTTQQWNTLTTVAVLGVIIGFLTLFFIKEKSTAGVGEQQKNNLKEKMDHCCD